MKVLVCGVRSWPPEDLVRQRLGRLPPGATIYVGEETGTDIRARKIALAQGRDAVSFYANPARDGDYAQEVLYRKLIDERPDLVLVFGEHSPIEKLARRANLTIEVVPLD